LFLAPDRNSVLALGQVCDDKRVKLWSLPFDGTAKRAIVEDPVLDVEDVVLDPEDGTVLAAKMSGMDGARRWLDPRAEQRQEALRRFFDTEWISTIGHSSNNERIVVKAEGKSKPPVYHVVDFGTKRADIINEAYSGLSATKFGPVRVFNYESRDLYPLVARLTFPPESVERNLPLVVLPHDGPEDRDGESFDWEAHFLASRGYAVLQPQFRGSTGFGLEHADAGRRQWGLRMQHDVTDAVRAVIAQGVADPKRVCIVGHGYGGYVALTGAAATPTLYACSVSISGISDLTYMLGHISRMSPDAYSPERKYWRDHIGRVSDSHVAIYSPARNAGRMTVPILLIHGSQDDVVPLSQSRVMARALKESGNPADLIELQDEDHWMSQSRNRIRMLAELERFLAKNMPSSGATN
jgi:dipeptidyl aminopeptidase/acylaminoacyl peptidase